MCKEGVSEKDGESFCVLQWGKEYTLRRNGPLRVTGPKGEGEEEEEKERGESWRRTGRRKGWKRGEAGPVCGKDLSGGW